MTSHISVNRLSKHYGATKAVAQPKGKGGKAGSRRLGQEQEEQRTEDEVAREMEAVRVES